MKTMTIKIDDELREQLQTIADREHRSLSNTARMAIREGIESFFLSGVSKHREAQLA